MMLRYLAIISFATLVRGKNAFDATRGCEQYDSSQGYNFPHPYYPISSFRHSNVTSEGVVKIRMGVYVTSGGHIRLAPKQFPYNGTIMDEIVLSGWNQQSFVRRYNRKDANNVTNVDNLLIIPSESLLSPFKPLMFTMTIHRDGLVQLTKDDQVLPFLEFTDNQNTFKFISFCNFETPAVYFFDCPLDYDESTALKCSEINLF